MINAKLHNVSIVISTYKGEAFIIEQLNTILNQTYPLYEIIIVDDASSDNTWSILQKIASREKIIKLYRNDQNLGYNKSFEKALQLATGDVIAISDQDDIWHLQKIEILLANWTDHTPLIYCNSILFEQTIPVVPKSNKVIRRIHGADPKKLSFYNTVSGHTMIIKRELLKLAFPFDTNVYYDWWLAIVATCNGGVSFVSDVLVYQRVHGKNVTIRRDLSKREHFLRCNLMLLDHLRKFQNINNIDNKDKKFFQAFYELWHQSLIHENNWKLFVFLMRNRKKVFSYKRRRISFISHLKHSYRYSFKNLLQA
ncbi:MAG TPA: glycosyltransferase [Flavisolibacter sp.]|nr:glycosyltransferase [Flavisolibacter sp.]